MSHVVNRENQELPRVVRELFAPILPHLERTEQVLARELRNDSPFVNDLLKYGGKLGGKRLRPALLFLAAEASGEVNETHDVLAAVVEMIHTATLVHDDVLDEAEMRRHLATVNARWNNEASVLLGDYLFSHAFYLASTVGSTFACQRIGRSTNRVCEGELMQVGHRGNHALTEDEYYQIIDGKTAELCACASHLGAKYACDKESYWTALEAYGRNLGMAFQIADDLLDLSGNEEETGKSLGTDVEKQKATLPIIHCYASADESERRQLIQLLDTPGASTRRELTDWFERFGALQYASTKAQKFAEAARNQLQPLPESAAKELLKELTVFVVARQK